MKSGFRFAVLIACTMFLLTACVFDKIKLPSTYDNEVTRWTSSLNGMSALEQGRRADAVWKSPSYSPELRTRALSIAASRPGPQAFAARKEFALRYERADLAQRKAWEAMYWKDLDSMASQDLRLLASRISPAQMQTFPWNLAMLKAARHGLAPDNSAALNQLSNPGIYANPSALGLVGSGMVSPVAGGGASVALAIPQSGSGGAIGRQVAAGALAASEYLRGKGKTIDVKIIDTSQADWQQQIQNLPTHYAVIGGPLGTSQLSAMKTAARGRILFAFTPNLPADEEGVHVWRFFTSPQDQVRAIISAASGIGITSFGVFAPSDNFGKRMAAIFQKEAAAQGYPAMTAYYTPSNMQAWTKEAKDFLSSVPDADAIFLPDDWKNMEMIIATLQYSGAQGRLFMGPSLWEQPLGAGATSNSAVFTTTIFPGVWYEQAPGRGPAAFAETMQARGERPSDWSALGFDFVQLAAELSLSQGLSASALNSMLSSSTRIDWAGAPFSWESSGRAQRKLSIFHPQAKGFSYANMTSISRQLNQQHRPSSSNVKPHSDVDRLAESITNH